MQQGRQLVDSGPHRFLRHPGNTGALAVFVAGCVLLRSWVAAVLATGALSLAFLRRIRFEEALLVRALPGYLAYMSCTGRLLPRILQLRLRHAGVAATLRERFPVAGDLRYRRPVAHSGLNLLHPGEHAVKYVACDQTADLEPGTMASVAVEGLALLLANVGGSYYAVSLKCTHMGEHLCNGSLDGNTVTCPLHGARFDVTTGQAVGKAKLWLIPTMPKNLQSFPVKVEGQQILIGIP
jgi:3-phenylpropionate/trans-cinnamate dioxygenase ferredoxin subunit